MTVLAVLATPAFGGQESARVDLSPLPIVLKNPAEAEALITRIDNDMAAYQESDSGEELDIEGKSDKQIMSQYVLGTLDLPRFDWVILPIGLLKKIGALINSNPADEFDGSLDNAQEDISNRTWRRR